MRDEKGRYISIIPKAVLVHPATYRTAWLMTTETTQPDTANRASNFYRQKLNLIAIQSPFVGTQSGGANTDWYLGDFKKQYVWLWFWKPEVLREGQNSAASFERDTIARFRYGYSAGVGSRDYRFVCKATA